jgi:hypothetical protein
MFSADPDAWFHPTRPCRDCGSVASVLKYGRSPRGWMFTCADTALCETFQALEKLAAEQP